ncbi:MAG TPA: hypothetical protein VH475_10980 [Tepidisphaeraceae bacterium]|jgi:hypothetical protein
MRRLGRWLLNAATVLSLLLFSAAVGLWSYTLTSPQVDLLTEISPARSYGLGTERGAMIGFLQIEAPSYREGDPDDAWRAGAGFRYVRITSDGMRRWNLVLPFWALAVLTLALPVARGLRQRRAHRRRRARERLGLCLACGYSLAGNVSGVCPECGEQAGDGRTRAPA